MAWSYDLYAECRGQHLFTVEVPKQGGKRVETKIVAYTTGINTLPEPGGMLDQPYRLMSLFQFFMAGDRMATFKQLS